jgi:hypothetical protein
MEPCVYCGAETKIYKADYPVCTKCVDRIDAGETLTKKPESASSGRLGVG